MPNPRDLAHYPRHPKVNFDLIPPLAGQEVAAFSETVELIYDSVLEPKRWEQALAAISALTGVSQVSLHFSDDRDENFNFGFFHGFTEAFARSAEVYAQQWIVQAGLPFWEVGSVYHLPDLMSREQLEASEFWHGCLVPHEQGDYMGLIALREGSRNIPMSLVSRKHEGDHSPRSIELTRLIARHICKAVKISSAFDLKTVQTDGLAKTLDALSASVFLLNKHGTVVHTNANADVLARSGDVLHVLHGKLRAVDSDSQAALARVIEGTRWAADRAPPVSVAIRRGTKSLVATVLPIGSGERQKVMSPFVAELAVFVQDPAQLQQPPAEALANLYGLTPAELRVTMLLVAGAPIHDIADRLGVKSNTVRTYIKSLLSKTDTSRQVDLVRLLTALSPPVGSPDQT